MKNFNKLAIFTFAMFGFTAAANAQSTATSNDVIASATVVAPIAIEHTGTLSFGEVVATAGVVTLSPDLTRTTTQVGVNPTVNADGIAVPVFIVTGQGGYTYAVSFSSEVNLTTPTVGAEPMVLNSFTTTENTGLIDATSGQQEFSVGANLTVNTGQAEGVYTGIFHVTVAYN